MGSLFAGEISGRGSELGFYGQEGFVVGGFATKAVGWWEDWGGGHGLVCAAVPERHGFPDLSFDPGLLVGFAHMGIGYALGILAVPCGLLDLS